MAWLPQQDALHKQDILQDFGLFLGDPGVDFTTSSLGRQFHSQVLSPMKPHGAMFNLNNSLLFCLIISIYAASIRQILKVNNVSHKTNG